MDKSHHEQLPLIARLMDDVFHVAQSWIEPQASTGETIDVLSYAERGVMQKIKAALIVAHRKGDI